MGQTVSRVIRVQNRTKETIQVAYEPLGEGFDLQPGDKLTIENRRYDFEDEVAIVLRDNVVIVEILGSQRDFYQALSIRLNESVVYGE